MSNTNSDSAIPTGGRFPIAAIGASAGGIGALQKFFPKVPLDSGVAYVVIQHLDAQHESVLAGIIQRCTALETTSAAEGQSIEPDKVYVVPPGVSVTIEDGSFRLAKMTPPAPSELLSTIFLSRSRRTTGKTRPR